MPARAARTRTRTAVAGGLVDSGLAALAAFASSVYASRTFDLALLGYYSVFLTAFVASSNIPGRLLFFPLEIAAVAEPDERRLVFVERGLLRGVPLALASALGAALVAGVISSGAGTAVLIPLVLSTALAATLSPLQDYTRRMLHVDHHSGQAAAVSAVQLGGVLALLVILHTAGVDPVWIPYLSLAGANAASLAAAVVMIGIARRVPRERPPAFKTYARSGWWLLYISLPGPMIGLVVNAIVLHLAGAATLGFAEAARQVGRPLSVVTTGLGMSLRPRSFAAAQRRQRGAARRVEKVFLGITLVAGLAYAAVAAVDWPLNVMASLIPKAYQIEGLVLAVILSNVALGIAFPSGYELMGSGRETTAARVESASQVTRLAVTIFTATLGAFTIAATDIMLGVSRFVGYRIGLKPLYHEPPPVEARSRDGGAGRELPTADSERRRRGAHERT